MKINYIENLRNSLRSELKSDGTEDDLLDLYALLVLTVGEECTQEHIHDAWSVWRVLGTQSNPEHGSLVPFYQLSHESKFLDEPYRQAVINVAKMEGK